VAHFLVLHGADLAAVNEDRQTAREMAESRGTEFLQYITKKEQSVKDALTLGSA
jgi:hypothetical protein